jgi:hypothetical protein
MMKSRTLAEKQRVRAIGDYSVTVDRSGTSSIVSVFHSVGCYLNVNIAESLALLLTWNLSTSFDPEALNALTAFGRRWHLKRSRK